MNTSDETIPRFGALDVHAFAKKLLVLFIAFLPFQQTYTAFMD